MALNLRAIPTALHARLKAAAAEDGIKLEPFCVALLQAAIVARLSKPEVAGSTPAPRSKSSQSKACKECGALNGMHQKKCPAAKGK